MVLGLVIFICLIGFGGKLIFLWGFFMMVFLVLFFGFVLVGLGIFIFIFIMFVGVVFFMVVGFRVVKKVYEEEELLIEVLEKLFEKIEVNVRLYLVI